MLALKRTVHVSDVYGEEGSECSILKIFPKGRGVMNLGFCFPCNCTSSYSSHCILLLILRLNKTENSASSHTGHILSGQ